MPFRHGKLFRLSHAGTAPSYVFATLHLSDPRITSFSPRLHAAITDLKVVALETVETGAVLRRGDRKIIAAAWRGATVAGADQRADRLLNKTDFARLRSSRSRQRHSKIGRPYVQTFRPCPYARPAFVRDGLARSQDLCR